MRFWNVGWKLLYAYKLLISSALRLYTRRDIVHEKPTFMSLHEVWKAAADSPFQPAVSKDYQLTVGFTLLLIGIYEPAILDIG